MFLIRPLTKMAKIKRTQIFPCIQSLSFVEHLKILTTFNECSNTDHIAYLNSSKESLLEKYEL